MSRWQTLGAWRYIVALLLISGTSGSVATTVIAGPGDPADLAITKTDGVATATPGGSVTYTITASNAGPSNATGATVADTFPAALTATWTCVGAGGGTCTAAGRGNINDTVNLPAGASVTYTVGARSAAAATGTLSNTATVTAPGGRHRSEPGQQLGDRHRHADRVSRSVDHQDRRRQRRRRRRLGDVHDHGEQRRPEQRDGGDRGRHVPGGR